MSRISRALYYEEEKQVVLFHTAPLPPDCTLISENSTTQGENNKDVLLDQVCPTCLSHGHDNITLYLAKVEEVRDALKRRVKIALSWSHARCAGQRYLIEFSPGMPYLSVLSGKYDNTIAKTNTNTVEPVYCGHCVMQPPVYTSH